MGAPKENKFWLKRARHGREVILSSPEIFLQEAYNYFADVQECPLYQVEYKVVNKALKKVYIPFVRPFTIDGLCLYLGIVYSTYRNFKDRCKTEDDQDFMHVFEQVEKIIYTQKFENAAAGFLKENIIARELGLADKIKTENNINLSDKPINFE